MIRLRTPDTSPALSNRKTRHNHARSVFAPYAESLARHGLPASWLLRMRADVGPGDLLCKIEPPRQAASVVEGRPE